MAEVDRFRIQKERKNKVTDWENPEQVITKVNGANPIETKAEWPTEIEKLNNEIETQWNQIKEIEMIIGMQ